MKTQYPITGNTINLERRKKRVKGITRFYSALNDFFQDLYRDEDENSEYPE